MISALIRKEFASMRPFIGLIVALNLISVIALFFEMPHRMSYASEFDTYFTGGLERSISVFIFAIAMASGVLMREYDEGTIEFLDSLPVSRTKVFFTKFLAAFSVLSLFIVLETVIGLVLHLISKDSLEPGFHWNTVAILIFLKTCQLFAMFSIGLAASYMRRFGWLAIGIVIVIFVVVKDRYPPIEVLNFFSYTNPGFEGQRCIVPWNQVLVSLAISLTLTLFSYLLFLCSDRIIAAYNRMGETRLGGAILIVGSISIAIVGVVLTSLLNEEFGEEPEIGEVVINYPSWSTSRTRTKYFNSVYPSNLSKKASLVLQQSDEVFEKVQTVLGSNQSNEILLDATSLIPRHAGLATWDTIRIDLNASDDVDTLLAILGHETAHVIMETMSDRRLSDIANYTRFWHEGVASYIEYHHFDSELDIKDYYRQAAYMRERDEVVFEELMDNAKLVASYDTLLAYSIGMIFVEALVKRYSEEAIGEVVEAMNRKDVPKNLSGMEFWRDTFQACDYSLDEVINTFFERLDEEVEKQQDWLNSIPEIDGSIYEDEYYFSIQIDWEPVDEWRPVCRFRQAEDSQDRHYRNADYIQSEGTFFSMDREFFPGGVAWYQIGLLDPDGVIVYQPWVKVAID